MNSKNCNGEDCQLSVKNGKLFCEFHNKICDNYEVSYLHECDDINIIEVKMSHVLYTAAFCRNCNKFYIDGEQ